MSDESKSVRQFFYAIGTLAGFIALLAIFGKKIYGAFPSITAVGWVIIGVALVIGTVFGMSLSRLIERKMGVNEDRSTWIGAATAIGIISFLGWLMWNSISKFFLN